MQCKYYNYCTFILTELVLAFIYSPGVYFFFQPFHTLLLCYKFKFSPFPSFLVQGLDFEEVGIILSYKIVTL